MKILTSTQVREADAYTIKHEPILSIDLMERAASTCTSWMERKYPGKQKFKIVAGPGNNGGDGLVIARQLAEKGYSVEVFLLKISEKLSDDASINLERLKKQSKVKVLPLAIGDDLPKINKDDIVIDSIFGSGLVRPVKGYAAEVISHINRSRAEVVAIDIPSGLYGEDNSSNKDGAIVRAKYTLTFQFPFLSFFLPENGQYTGEWEALHIGLHPKFIGRVKTNYFYITREDVQEILRPRKKFSHKGTYGHALLVSGAYGKMGAAVLASRACLRAGIGLLTTHVPKFGCEIIQVAVPEAIVSIDQSDTLFSGVPDAETYDAIGIGPGIGCKNNTCMGLKKILMKTKKPMVIDADGLNILSNNKEWLELIPENSILTPHPKEFERLAGPFEDDYSRNLAQIGFAKKYNAHLVLKGAHTAVACPDGTCYFNTTGNPGMATAGSGDVLTGIILALLGQGYPPKEAALAGVYLHGLSGDLALEYMAKEALIASDIIEYLKKAFTGVRN